MGSQPEILLFHLDNCMFCKKAKKHFDEIINEKPEFRDVFSSFEWVEESVEEARAGKYDYYFVPACYINGEKVHEGAMSYQQAEKILELAIVAVNKAQGE